MVGSHRLREHPVDGPSLIDALQQRRGSDTRAGGPLNHCQCLPVMGQPKVCPDVTHLFCSSRPSAILSSVVTVVINPVKTMPRCWARPHIGEELRERIPLRADGDASAAIAWVTFVLGVRTPILHSYPRSIFGGASATMLRSNPSAALCHRFKAKATTRRRMAGSKVADNRNVISPTIARAQPLLLMTASPLGMLGHQYQSSKPLTRDGHGRLYLHRTLQRSGATPPVVDAMRGLRVAGIIP